MKSLFVTGANGGLAIEALKHLQKEEFTKVYLGCRNLEKANTTKSNLEITNSKNQKYIPVGGLDMLNPFKIKDAIESLPTDEKFDTVFLGSGGVIFSDNYETFEFKGQSYEKTVFQNVIGGCITTYLLKKNNLLKENARIIIAGGEGARGIPKMMDVPHFETTNDFESYVLGDFTNAPKYNPMNAIGNSKFISAIWCRAMLDSGIDIDTIWFSPGLTYGTNGLSGLTGFKQWFAENIAFGIARFFGLAQSPSDGGRKFANAISGKIGNKGDILGAPQGKTLGKISNQIPMNPDMDKLEFKRAFSTILQGIYQHL